MIKIIILVHVTDWYDSLDGNQEEFRARSVVGGLHIKALAEAPTFAIRSLPQANLLKDQVGDFPIELES